MSLQIIEVPESVERLIHSQQASRAIEVAQRQIDVFMRSGGPVITNFVNCDFQLLDKTLAWIQQQHLLTGDRFCELGSGFGVATILAAIHGLESYGIEIEPRLVQQSAHLAAVLEIDAYFYSGSFIPRGMTGLSEISYDIKHVDTDEGDVYDELELSMDDFDLFFAFPWPGEDLFFEAIFDQQAAVGALLLMYHGREGMKLLRKG